MRGDGALDPGDEYGLELALQLVEAGGGEVTVVSMGPAEALAGVQRALAMGAHRGLLVTEPALRGADALVTARVLAAAMARSTVRPRDRGRRVDRRLHRHDAGRRSPSCSASRASRRRASSTSDGDAFRVERQTESGYDVLTAPARHWSPSPPGATDPRYPSLKGIMAAKSKPVDTRERRRPRRRRDLAATADRGRRDRRARRRRAARSSPATTRSRGSPTSWPTRR